MATKFKEGSSIKREVRIYGIKAPVIVTLKAEGIEMCVAGQKTKAYASWEDVLRGMRTPLNVPSYLAGKPFELLKHQEAKRRKKNEEADLVR